MKRAEIKKSRWTYSDIEVIFSKDASELNQGENLYSIELASASCGTTIFKLNSDSSKIEDIPFILSNIMEKDIDTDNHLSETTSPSLNPLEPCVKNRTYHSKENLDDFFDNDYFLEVDKYLHKTVNSFEETISKKTQYNLLFGYPLSNNTKIYQSILLPEVPVYKLAELKEVVSNFLN